jgi:hypothetical protein
MEKPANREILFSEEVRCASLSTRRKIRVRYRFYRTLSGGLTPLFGAVRGASCAYAFLRFFFNGPSLDIVALFNQVRSATDAD